MGCPRLKLFEGTVGSILLFEAFFLEVHHGFRGPSYFLKLFFGRLQKGTVGYTHTTAAGYHSTSGTHKRGRTELEGELTFREVSAVWRQPWDPLV